MTAHGKRERGDSSLTEPHPIQSVVVPTKRVKGNVESKTITLFSNWIINPPVETTWMGIAEHMDTYRNLTVGSSKYVECICKKCNLITRKQVSKFVTRGCSQPQCRKYKLQNVAMRRLDDVLQNNKGECATIKGDVVEQRIVEALMTHCPEQVVAAQTMGSLNGTYDVVVRLASTTTTERLLFGGQVKLAYLSQKTNPNNYQFKQFTNSYIDCLPLIAKAGQTTKWLVASCGVLRRLTKMKSNTYHFNINSPVFQPYLFDSDKLAVQALLCLFPSSTCLTRDVVMRDLYITHALEQWSTQVVRSRLLQHGEGLRRNNTSSNAVDAFTRSCRLQLKSTSCSQKGRDGVLMVGLSHHAGHYAGKQDLQPYEEHHFDWVIVIGAHKYKKEERNFALRNVWYIPMKRLVERGYVRTTSGAVGVKSFAVASPGHVYGVGNAFRKYKYPYFEDCCDNIQPLLDELRAGKYGQRESNVQLSLLDELFGS